MESAVGEPVLSPRVMVIALGRCVPASGEPVRSWPSFSKQELDRLPPNPLVIVGAATSYLSANARPSAYLLLRFSTAPPPFLTLARSRPAFRRASHGRESSRDRGSDIL